jgi:hypothetical protein
LKVAAANRLDRRTMFKKWKRIWIMVGVVAVVATLVVCLHPKLSSPVNGGTNVIYEGDQIIPKLDSGFGILESKITFDGVYPGWSGTVPLTIINGQDRDRLFVVSVISASNPQTGYEVFPQQYLYWIVISRPEVTVSKGGNVKIPITLTVPEVSNYKGKAEVRILVEDTTQTGLVQIALESRWFIIIG